jgi:hypothetical protein
MTTAKGARPIGKEDCQHHHKNPARARTSPHTLRAVPLRGECYRTHRCAPPPTGCSSAGGRQRRKCYPCVVPLCYPCVVSPPTPALSPLRGEGVALGVS